MLGEELRIRYVWVLIPAKLIASILGAVKLHVSSFICVYYVPITNFFCVCFVSKCHWEILPAEYESWHRRGRWLLKEGIGGTRTEKSVCVLRYALF